MNNTLEQIWFVLGDGYGFNGPRAQGIKEITPIIEDIMSAAFVAGRSQMTWETFKNEWFNSPTPVEEKEWINVDDIPIEQLDDELQKVGLVLGEEKLPVIAQEIVNMKTPTAQPMRIEFTNLEMDQIKALNVECANSRGGFDGDLKWDISDGKINCDLFYDARDVDGDWGRASTRHSNITFEELIETIKSPTSKFDTRSWN